MYKAIFGLFSLLTIMCLAGIFYDNHLWTLRPSPTFLPQKENGIGFLVRSTELKHQSPAGRLPIVLAWTTFVKNKMMEQTLLEARGWTNKIAFVPFNQSRCAFKCVYTDDRKLASKASVIVFHMYRRADQDFHLEDLPPPPSSQLYVFFRTESPVWYSNENSVFRQVPRNFFNLTMTYSPNSDIFLPYDSFQKIHITHETPPHEIWQWHEVVKKVKRKSQLALQIVSHCKTSSGREKYVKELRRFLNLTELGKCGSKGATPMDDSQLSQILDEHFFYLAFENAVCNFYVTEKFWNLKRLIVPVVLSDRPLAGLGVPRHSYIAATDFESPQHLAKYLLFLQQNPDQYLKYFEWTRHYKRTSEVNPLCQLCEWAVEGRRKTLNADIVGWFEKDAQCSDGFVDKVLLRNINVEKRKKG